MSAQDEVHKLLKRSGAKLIRSKKHNIWRLPNGRNFVTPQTPSDTRGWNNSLPDLRKALGIHREPSPKRATEDRTPKPGNLAEPTFLADVTPAEERPTAPEGRQPRPEPEREVVPLYGAVPTRPDKHAPHRTPRPRPGLVKLMSPEVTAQAQFILRSQGEAAMTQYLNEVRTGTLPNGKEVNSVNDLVTPAVDAVAANGSLESSIAEQRKRIKFYHAQEEQARVEALRAEQMVAVLEQALSIQSAPRDRFRDHANGSDPAVQHPRRQNRERGFWTRTIREVVGTSPISLTRSTLCDELRKQVPGCTYGAAYASLLSELRSGRIVEDKDQFVRLAPEVEASAH